MKTTIELLNATRRRQQNWVNKQDWYTNKDFDYKLYEVFPFLDIFKHLPREWNEKYIEDLFSEESISEERYEQYKKGAEFSVDEKNQLLMSSADGAVESLYLHVAKAYRFSFDDAELCAVFVGWGDFRGEFDGKFIGIFEDEEGAKPELERIYSDVLVRDSWPV